MRPHIAKIVKEQIAKFGWELLPHPPYLPGVALFDYCYFLSLKNFMPGKE